MGNSDDQTKKSRIFNLPIAWVVLVLFFVVGACVLVVLLWCLSRKKFKKTSPELPISDNQTVSSEIKEILVD